MDFRHRKNSFLFKSFSSFLILSFVFNQVAFGNPIETQISISPAPGITASLEDFVTVSDVYSPNSRHQSLTDILHGKSQAVIYIEDAHGNISAQRNISAALQRVAADAKLSSPWIALEGTRVGEVDHRILSAFPDKAIRHQTSEYFLRSGEIDGADHYTAISNPKARIFGVDDEVLAEKNRESYRQYIEVRPKTEQALDHLRQTADLLKKKIYYGDLVLWDSSVQTFERNTNHFLKHLTVLKELAEKNQISLTTYPHISNLIELKTLEARMTEGGLKKDIQAFKDQSGIQDLTAGKILELTQKDPDTFNAFPQLKDHARFLDLSSRLEGIPVFREVSEASDALWDKLLSYREARDAFEIDRTVSFYEKLFDFSLLPEEYAHYLKDPAYFSMDRLSERIRDYNFLLHPKSLRPEPREIELVKGSAEHPLSFYRIAEERNERLTNNLLALLAKNPDKKAFFIAGGFHKRAITDNLKAKKVSYIVLSPKITDSEGNEAYWEWMGGSTTQLDLALTALSTVKKPDFLPEDPFRAKVGMVELALLDLMGSRSPGNRQALIEDFKTRISPKDGKMIEILSASMRPQDDKVEISLPGQLFEAKLTGPDNGLEVVSGASLGQSFVAVNMEKAAALLKAKSIDPDAFKPLMIQPFKGAPLLTYDYFRDKALEYLVKTANGSGLPISLPLQRQLLDLMFPAAVQGQPVEKAERAKFETSLQHLASPEAISFQFNSSSYLFSGGVKEKQILINVPALQSLQSETNEYVVNVLFAVIIYYQMIYQQGSKSRIEDTTKLFYKALDTLIQAVESKQKVKLGYQGTAVEKWFSTVVENNVENAESTNLFSNIIRSVNRVGFAPGMKLKDRFKIIRFLDQGGMGAVWQAVDLENNNLVVVKQVLPSALQDSDMRGRFYREIRALGRNQHNPHIAKLLSKQIPEEDAAEEAEPNQRIYYVMEWAPGANLEQLVRRGDLKLEESVNIVIQLLRGLEQVHKTQTIHRDLKPLNIKVDTQNHNFVRFFDFGLARPIDEPDDTNADKEASITQAGDVIGSPQYMSPEQATGAKDKVTYTTDIFSVGSILYRLITGELPFDGPNTQAVLMKVATMDYKPLSPAIPKALQTVVRKALAKDPADRYQSAGEFAQALEDFLKGDAIHTAQSDNLKMLTAAKAGTGRKKLVPGKVEPRKPVADSQKPQSALSWPWLAGGAALVAVIGGVLMMGRGKDNVKPPVDNPPVVIQKDDPAEIARKQEEEKQRIEREKRLAEQQKLSSEIGDLNVKIGELDGISRSVDQILASMKKQNGELKVLSEKAPQSLDNIPGLEQMDAAVKKGKKDLENQAFLADQNIKSFDQKMREIQESAKALLARPSISEIQQSQVNAFLKGLGTKKTEMDAKRGEVAKNQAEPDDYIEQVKNALIAAKDPVRGKEIMVNAEIKKLQGLVAELLKSGDLKGLDAALGPMADLRTKIADKSKELVKLYVDISTEVARQAKLPEVKEADRKTLQDLEGKLQLLSDEFKSLTDPIPPTLKAFEDPFALLNDLITKIDKSVTAVNEIAKGDAKFADKLTEVQNKAAEAKPVRDTLATKKTTFDKVAADLKDRSLTFALDNKIAAAKLAVARVETVWGKANTEPKWTELRKPYADAVTTADMAVKDPKTPKDQLQTKKDELTAAKQALADFNKKITDARDLQKGIPGILSDFKSDLGIPETRKSGLAEKLNEFKSLLDASKPTPQQLTRLAALRTELTPSPIDEKLDDKIFSKKSADSLATVGISLEIGASSGVNWTWDGKTTRGLTFYSGNTQLKEPNFEILKDGEKPVFQPLNQGEHSVIFLPTKLNFTPELSFHFEVQVKMHKTNNISEGFRMGVYQPINETDGVMLHMGIASDTGGVAFSKVKNKFGSSSNYSDKNFDVVALGKTIPYDEMIILSIHKDRGDKAIKYFINNKEVYSSSDITEGNISFFLHNINVGKKPDQSKIYGISIKAKSLGSEENLLDIWALSRVVQSQSKIGIILIPYGMHRESKELLDMPAAHLEGAPIKRNLKIYIPLDDESYQEARMIFKKYKFNKEDGVLLLPPNTVIKIDHQLVLSTDVIDRIYSRAAYFLKEHKEALGRPVIYETDELTSIERVDINKLDKAFMIPIAFNQADYIHNVGYRTASDFVAVALSKGDNTNYGITVKDGKISIMDELFDVFQKNIRAVIELARAA